VSNRNIASFPTQSQGLPISVTASLRPVNHAGDSVRAFADVRVSVEGYGDIELSGFAVFAGADGQRPRIAPPGHKGKVRFFEHVRLMGRIHGLVEAAILAEYEKPRGG